MRPNTILDDIAPIIGFSATCRLAGHLGGKVVYVPKPGVDFTSESELAGILSRSEFNRLQEAFPGEKLTIPYETPFSSARRDRNMAAMLAANLPVTDVAAACECSNDTVKRFSRAKA